MSSNCICGACVTAHCLLAFAILSLHTLSIAFLKLTASGRPTAPPRGLAKCLRFGHWLTLFTLHILLTYLLTFDRQGSPGQGGRAYINVADISADALNDIPLSAPALDLDSSLVTHSKLPPVKGPFAVC